MRPSFQPLLPVGVYRFFELLGMRNPFWTATFLRLLSAFLSFGAVTLMLNSFKKDFCAKTLETCVIPLSFFFWFQVYFGARFSSENWGGALFAIGLGTALTSSAPSFRRFVLTGFLFGLSFLCRFQMALMCGGCFLWFLLIKRTPLRALTGLFLGLGVAVVFGILMDLIFYGEWILTPWNYLYHNIVANKLNEFGLSPWHFYVTKFFQNGVPPLSLVFLTVFVLFPIRHPLHVLSFCLIPFFLVHQLIGHKEIRFLFPLVYFFPAMSGQIFEDFSHQFSKVPSRLFKGMWGLNFLLLIIILSRPADGHIPLFRKINQRLEKGKTLYYLNEDPYQVGHLPINFYRPKDLKTVQISLEALQSEKEPNLLLVSSKPLGAETNQEAFRLIYSSLPKWILRFNINRWVERTPTWWLYEFSGSK